MAPKKLKYSELGDTAKYYRKNPRARKVKAAKDKEVNSRDSQVKKRVELNKRRRRDKAKGVDTSKTDLAHTKKGLVRKSIKANRGSSSDSAGDARARKKGIKRKK